MKKPIWLVEHYKKGQSFNCHIKWRKKEEHGTKKFWRNKEWISFLQISWKFSTHRFKKKLQRSTKKAPGRYMMLRLIKISTKEMIFKTAWRRKKIYTDCLYKVYCIYIQVENYKNSRIVLSKAKQRIRNLNVVLSAKRGLSSRILHGVIVSFEIKSTIIFSLIQMWENLSSVDLHFRKY